MREAESTEIWGAWLSYRQAGAYLGGISRDTLRRRIDAGEIRAVRIERASLDTFMEGQRWRSEVGEE